MPSSKNLQLVVTYTVRTLCIKSEAGLINQKGTIVGAIIAE
jgi:hypothetical protein